MFFLASSGVGAPDLTGDGVPERLVVPTAFSRDRHSACVVEDGAAATALRAVSLGSPDDALGFSACWIADLDGDGKEDLAITAPLAVSNRGIGRAYAVSSLTGRVIHTFEPAHTGQFGLLVEPALDGNSDGVGDIAVWSRFVDTTGRAINIRWVFSGASGETLSPASESAAGNAVKSDVTLDLVVNAEDLLATLDALDTSASAPGYDGDIDGDQLVDVIDLSTVAEHVGEALDDPPGPLAFVGWACEKPDRRGGGGVVQMLVLPDVSASSPVCPGEGGGGSGGGGPGGGIGRIPGPVDLSPPWEDPAAIDDLPFDPFNDGPSCAPDLDRSSNYICLATDVACQDFVLLSSRPDTRWQVIGATIVQPAMLGTGTFARSITIRVCQPGVVTVMMSSGDSACTQGRTRTFRVVRTDVDLDSDNTSILAPPDRSPQEEAVESLGQDPDHPGKVIKVSSWDSDSDGVEDFVDGFNFFGSAWSDDDLSTHAAPKVVVSVDGPIDDTALVYILYDASTIEALRAGFPDSLEVPFGTLRLWAKDTSSERDPRPLLEGGDFVAPGAYPVTLLRQRLGAFAAWTLHVEAVNAGLTTIAAYVDPDGDRTPPQGATPPPGPADEPPMCPDVAQVTATKLTLFARAHSHDNVAEGEAHSFVTRALVATAFRPRAEDLAEGVDVGSMPFGTWMAYQLVVEDWRGFQSSGIQIGNITLPLVRVGESDRHETMWFMVRDPSEGPPLGAAAFPTLDLNGWINIHYNPDQPVKAAEKLSELKHVNRVKDIVDRVVGEFPDLPAGAPRNNPGAYGTLIHQKVGEALQGEARWYSSVWIDTRTKQVLAIGTPPTGVDFTFVKEADLAYMKQGRTLTIGQIFKADDVVDLFEIKASASGLPDDAQRQFYRDLMGGKPPKAVSVVKRMRRVNGVFQVVDNAKIKNKIRILKKAAVAGAAVGALCIVQIVNGEEERRYQEFVEKVHTYQTNPDTTQKLADGAEMTQALYLWMDTWCPFDIPKGLVVGASLYQMLRNEWEPIPEDE